VEGNVDLAERIDFYTDFLLAFANVYINKILKSPKGIRHSEKIVLIISIHFSE
jgi:hypothetical protein